MAIYKQASFDNGEKFPRYAIVTTKDDSYMPFYSFHVVVTSEDDNYWCCTIVKKPEVENFKFKKDLFDCDYKSLAELYYKE